jgi:hypothetical protein
MEMQPQTKKRAHDLQDVVAALLNCREDILVGVWEV